MQRERIRQKIAEQKAKKLAAKRGQAATATAAAAPAAKKEEAPAVIFDPVAQKVESAAKVNYLLCMSFTFRC